VSGRGEPPAGYVRVAAPGAALVAQAAAAAGVVNALSSCGTLYDYARTHPERRTMHGRAPVYAAPLPTGGGRVVVRHSRHGGLLAPLTGDRFVRPSRAGVELAAALRLAAAGVRTPELVAYALYPAGPLLCRADVATREVPDARDLGEWLADVALAHATAEWTPPVVELLAALGRAGARHPDLNVKNVLLAPSGPGRRAAYVLDVDRVVFDAPGDPRVTAANVARLLRSARKRRAQGLARVSEGALGELAAAASRAAEAA
jgi:3-deoxy-D-manno-octulosonic acid kinase